MVQFVSDIERQGLPVAIVVPGVVIYELDGWNILLSWDCRNWRAIGKRIEMGWRGSPGAHLPGCWKRLRKEKQLKVKQMRRLVSDPATGGSEDQTRQVKYIYCHSNRWQLLDRDMTTRKTTDWFSIVACTSVAVERHICAAPIITYASKACRMVRKWLGDMRHEWSSFPNRYPRHHAHPTMG